MLATCLKIREYSQVARFKHIVVGEVFYGKLAVGFIF